MVNQVLLFSLVDGLYMGVSMVVPPVIILISNDGIFPHKNQPAIGMFPIFGNFQIWFFRNPLPTLSLRRRPRLDRKASPKPTDRWAAPESLKKRLEKYGEIKGASW